MIRKTPLYPIEDLDIRNATLIQSHNWMQPASGYRKHHNSPPIPIPFTTKPDGGCETLKFRRTDWNSIGSETTTPQHYRTIFKEGRCACFGCAVLFYKYGQKRKEKRSRDLGLNRLISGTHGSPPIPKRLDILPPIILTYNRVYPPLRLKKYFSAPMC